MCVWPERRRSFPWRIQRGEEGGAQPNRVGGGSSYATTTGPHLLRPCRIPSPCLEPHAYSSPRQPRGAPGKHSPGGSSEHAATHSTTTTSTSSSSRPQKGKRTTHSHTSTLQQGEQPRCRSIHPKHGHPSRPPKHPHQNPRAAPKTNGQARRKHHQKRRIQRWFSLARQPAGGHLPQPRRPQPPRPPRTAQKNQEAEARTGERAPQGDTRVKRRAHQRGERRIPTQLPEDPNDCPKSNNLPGGSCHPHPLQPLLQQGGGS